MKNTILTMLNKLITMNSNLYYKSGDVIDYSNCKIHTYGCLTGSKKSIQLFLPLHKSLMNITSSKVNRLYIIARKANGGYIFDTADTPKNVTEAVKTCFPNFNNSIYIQCGFDSDLNTVNNIPLSIAITSIKLTLT